MNINIEVIPNDKHRPGITGADWYWSPDGTLQVRVSKMSDWRFEAVLAMHEAAEAILCKHRGVDYRNVDEFDQWYEKNHPTTKIEAGDDPNAPYRKQHGFATAIERILAAEMGVDWPAYDKELEAL